MIGQITANTGGTAPVPPVSGDRLTGAMSEDTVIEISNVWKIFGSEPMAALQAIRERGLSTVSYTHLTLPTKA